MIDLSKTILFSRGQHILFQSKKNPSIPERKSLFLQSNTFYWTHFEFNNKKLHNKQRNLGIIPPLQSFTMNFNTIITKCEMSPHSKQILSIGLTQASLAFYNSLLSQDIQSPLLLHCFFFRDPDNILTVVLHHLLQWCPLLTAGLAPTLISLDLL